ncbi:hypothetical protein [Wolbachia endosymbiont (group A) of Apoderus coryli]|uniref:hypothetical protein n=1 Tax=Wolbachia endosymbiont (group A) of Apoderus coryli TaxID=2953980 RepID=UPI0022303DD5|nr:hypothetical protein [Wolbachia endosymbiont (group A) of Apoderus coryli]
MLSNKLPFSLLFYCSTNQEEVSLQQMVSFQCLTLESSFFIIIKTLYFNIKRLLLCLLT